ncbi:PQQ-binding-like beta-propeller repeat protein [Undibacterium sp. CY18W]|uniref:PQQ-binding-like beta-propeller repeat protein n=1 Tax=Undibacterium hunanense TaxID=2762292 RepID=A0ABR6ZTN1_9BURK|nr:PQQ-binding-like beta-propeller repeat protein [Undibacterium hunanense]MBC3919004.1 PQQ-binding-like beta-propeller repeat protein [Undibacterium hunanense]
MKKFRRALSLVALTLTVTACGGGGGGSSAGQTSSTSTGNVNVPAVSNDPGLTLDPSVLTAVVLQGDSLSVPVIAHANKNFPSFVNIGIVDTAGVLNTNPTIYGLDATTYRAMLTTSPKLAVGTYSGVIEVRLCKDFAVICAQPHEGSPWKLPYSIEVRAPNLKTLSALPGAQDWTTFQGNKAHTGYVPVNLDVNSFSLRFLAKSNIKTAESDIVTQGGITSFVESDGYAATNGNYIYTSAITALDEATGSVKWTFPTSNYRLNSPAAENGKVYFVGDENGRQYFSVLDQASGKQLAKVNSYSGTYTTYLAPVADEQSVIVPVSFSNGVASFNPTTLSTNWLGSRVSDYSPNSDRWTAAMDTDFTYVYSKNSSADNSSVMVAFDRKNGQIASRVANPDDKNSNDSLRSAPAICSNKNLLMTRLGSYLTNFDMSSSKIKWGLRGEFNSNPVCTGTTFYIINGKTIEARSLESGALQWTWALPSLENFVFSTRDTMPLNLILTNNVLLATSNSSVYAIDLGTHKTVWTYARSGYLSMSKNGVLYVRNFEGYVTAFNTH